AATRWAGAWSRGRCPRRSSTRRVGAAVLVRRAGCERKRGGSGIFSSRRALVALSPFAECFLRLGCRRRVLLHDRHDLRGDLLLLRLLCALWYVDRRSPPHLFEQLCLGASLRAVDWFQHVEPDLERADAKVVFHTRGGRNAVDV